MTDTVGMELLERESPLACLAEWAAEARRGDGRLVVLGGEAGVGKTALLERFQQDLPDARWSWGACDGLFTPRPLGPLYDLAAPAAARRAARLASHREAVAQFERALRFTAGTDPAMAAALYDDLATELALLDRAEAAADAGQHALELWRTAGDRLREGDSTRRLSGMMRSLCRGQDAETAAQTAVAILESLAPGVEIAQAYANLAAQEMLTGRYEAAIETARRAQSLADLARAPQVLSDALNSEAVAAAILGREWTGLLERALQIALAEGLRAEAGRAYCNIHAMHCDQRRYADADRYYSEASPIATSTTWPPSGPSCAATRLARWRSAGAGTRRWP
jgi:tetratricopeptide (TPR) repeat protein